MVEDDVCGHGLNDRDGTGHCAHVVASTRMDGHGTALTVHGWDVAHQCCDGLESYLKVYVVTIADATLYTT